MGKKVQEEIPELKYRGFVWNLSVRYWAKLPMSVRVWVDAEDLAQDCLLHVRRRLLSSYDGRASLCTFIHVGVENYLKNICEFYGASKRYTPALKSIVGGNSAGSGRQADFDKPLDLEIPTSPSAHLSYVEAADALNFVLTHASTQLRSDLRSFFAPTRRPTTKKFERGAREELRILTSYCGLTPDDFRLLLTSGYVVA